MDSANFSEDQVRFSVALLIAILIAVGSYLHATRNSSFGFYTLLLSAGVLILSQGIILFTGAVFYFYGLTGGIIRILPGVFAVLAVYFGFRTRQSVAPS